MGKVLHASYSGYFPYCLVDFYQDPYPQFGAVSLETAMKFFWVLRKFTLSGTYLAGEYPYTTQNFSLTFKSSAEKEEDLVCNPAWQIESSSNVADVQGWFESGGTEIYKYGSLYVPYFYFTGFYVDSQGGGFIVQNLNTLGQFDPLFVFEGIQMFGVNGNATNFQMIPNEYWSYDGTWNTQTGQRLT